jgi:hypothetical protein
MTDDNTLTLDKPLDLCDPVTDPTEAQLMTAEYGLLLNKILTACNGTSTPVAAAACMSAAFCTALAGNSSAEDVVKYLSACFHDCLEKVPEAVAQRMTANGDEVLAYDTRSDA